MSIKETYSKVKAWNYRLGEKMRQPVAIPDVVHEHHICQHCDYGYYGRFCPQCGMSAVKTRFTFKRLTSSFLDIWGFGSRSMFRTICDLLWRPGYLIRDYLSGHHLSYFPPFKMLAVFTIIIVFVAWVFGFKDPLVGAQIAQDIQEIPSSSKMSTYAIDYICRILIYLDKNDFYRILIQNVFVVLSAWIVFHSRGYNLVETFFSQIYINCQLHLVALVWMLVTWDLPPTVMLPYYVPASLSFIVLIFDYKQLYGLTFKQSIWQTILFILLILAIYFVMFFLIIIIISLTDKIVS